MRLIGNKTKLLPEIEGFLQRRGVHGGTLLDVFAGTASVGRHFRRLGWRVRTNDLLASSYTIQRAYVAQGGCPRLEAVRAARSVRTFLASPAGRAALEETPGASGCEPLREVVAYLNALDPAPGLVARQYAEGGPGGRLFFSRENGARIDAVHACLSGWRAAGLLEEDELYLLLALLLEAADRVANISGTYGAFLKHLQAAAREPLRMRVPGPEVFQGPAGRAYRQDANRLVRRVRTDVLYLDPPYNHRQYAKNYHVLEVLAELHQVRDLAAYEAAIYGVSGLVPVEDRLSDYCRRVGRRRSDPSPCKQAFFDLVRAARAEHIVVSYNEEGILTREEIGQALAEACGWSRYDFDRHLEEISYKRFRSDADAAGKREYRVLEGRSRDEVREWLFYARKPVARGAARPARALAV